MPNMLDYLDWRGDIPFSASPFNEVDNLLLSHLAYLELDGIVPSPAQGGAITLRQAGVAYAEKFGAADKSLWPPLKFNVMEMLRRMQDTPRFDKCRLSRYVNIISMKQECQFSAVTVALPDGSLYLAFSGTDNSVAGWKENFNLSFLSETAGQLYAVQYVEKASPYWRRRMRLGGHSKGGNFAVYAAAHVRPSVGERILAVYNNDGPGFRESLLTQEAYQKILPRVHTVLPRSSVIGRLLEHGERYDVVESDGNGILQHDAMTWQVKGTAFLHCDALDADSDFMDKTLSAWVADVDLEQRRQFVDALFAVITAAHIEDTDELTRLDLAKISALVKARDGLSPESREVLDRTLRLLLEEMYRGLKERRRQEKTAAKKPVGK